MQTHDPSRSAAPSSRRIRNVALATVLAATLLFAASEIRNISVSPSTLAFTSSNPNATDTKQAILLFRIHAGKDKAWDVKVSASSATLVNCPLVPTSSITVQCASVGIVGGGNIGTGACASQFSLSTTPTTTAAGITGDGDQDYTIPIDFIFADKWKYPGATSACTLTATYTINAVN